MTALPFRNNLRAKRQQPRRLRIPHPRVMRPPIPSDQLAQLQLELVSGSVLTAHRLAKLSHVFVCHRHTFPLVVLRPMAVERNQQRIGPPNVFLAAQWRIRE